LQERRAVVLGDPGAGKTTLLRYLTYILAKAQIADHQSDIINRIPDLADCLPVYVRIGEYAQHLQHDPAATLDAFVLLSCQAHQLPLSNELLTDALDRNRAVFLLDGLDEVIAAGQRGEVARRIEEFARAHPPCRVIVTSRIVGYREGQLGGGFPQLTISPFADPGIRGFAEKWYGALGEPVGNAERLVRAIQDNLSVRRLAANPLLLTVIALIHWRGTKLPHHRAKLYSQAAETLVDQWMNQRRVSPEGWDVHETLQVLLPATAWHLHSTTSSGLIGEQELHNLLVETLQQHDPRLSENAAHSRASQFRRNVSEFSGIFLERGLDQDGRGLYGFLHLTFEEYFTAVHLADKWEREGKSVLKPLLHDPRWSETILLTAGLLSESSQYRATRFVKTILSARSEYENILHRDSLMAARCLADDVRVDAEVRRAISGKLLKLYFDFKLPGALREDIRQVFARLRGTTVEKDVLETLIERFTDSDENVRGAAARALGQMGAAAATPEVRAAPIS
jgi:predicted NACHT family NTPase